MVAVVLTCTHQLHADNIARSAVLAFWHCPAFAVILLGSLLEPLRACMPHISPGWLAGTGAAYFASRCGVHASLSYWHQACTCSPCRPGCRLMSTTSP